MKTLLWIVLFLCHQAFALPSVAFFYGKQVPSAKMCLYDMIVVDPFSDFDPEDCAPKTQAFAYVNVGEVDKFVPYAKNIRPEWVIGENSAWNKNPVLDQTQKNWQTFFIKQLIDPLWKKGYRGFFLDTLDSYILAVHDSLAQQKQVDALVSLIQQIKQRYPDAKIMLNRGFHLLDRVASQIDSVAIESLYHGWYQDKLRYATTPLSDQKELFKQIDRIQRLNKPIIIIDYLPPNQQDKAPALAAQLAQKGLIPWITDKSLQEIYIKKSQGISRNILVMFSDEKKLPIQYIPAALYVSPILEYMGYIPTYFNLDETQAFPTGDLKNNYAGIILWLEKQDLKHVALLKWIHKQIKNGVRVVFLNSFGVPIETKTLAQMGLFAASLQDTIATLTITKMDPKLVGYEVQPIKTPYYFYPIQSRSSNILLQLKNSELQTEDAVAITAWGGYALNPYVIQALPNATSRWVINPFEFFQQALLLQDFPIPDTTTENGRRLMSVHIDGDGFAYPAKWIGGHFAAEELRDRVLKKFPIPTSFSVITGEIAPNGTQPALSPQLMGIAQSIFALSWIEIASHSFSHPFDWQVADKTNFKQPAMAIHPTTPYSAEGHQGVAGGATPYPRQGRNDVVVTGIESEQPYALKIPHYKFNLQEEITGSIDFINKNLAPSHKKSHLLFWSGLANPSAQALALAQQNQLLNINGLSNTNIDISNPSLTSIRPMGVAVGGYYQVFAPIQMDFFYMNSFLGPMYGFEQVIQTFQLTDKPRRFKPIDLYYHIYSASQPASLQALLNVYRWALAQPVMNIYISEYIEKVLGRVYNSSPTPTCRGLSAASRRSKSTTNIFI